MEGGSDTTSTFLQWFITLVTAHPAVQRKLQEEIDGVVGNNRVPAFEDFERLPYLQVHSRY
jgi:cytochrome P450